MTQDEPTNGISDLEYRKQETVLRQYWLAKFLQAMREDLSEWISSLAFHVTVKPDHFLESLENGVILCQQARLIQRYAEEYSILNPQENLKIPAKEVYYTEKGALPRSFVARDNVANFISWCRELGIPDVVLFESEDLVSHKNEKSVVLTLLDVARKAYKFGVQPPEIVKFEKEIDEEIEKDKENEKMGRPPPKPIDLEENNNLDTMVRNIVNRCTCYDRFPIKKLAEGKYQLGRNDTLIFVRVMRKHVMVRIGGGWDTFDHYITKHDPCRTKIAGNIDNNGHNVSPVANNNNSLPQRKKSSQKRESIKSDPYSTTSSDTWSMCSESSDGSGSLESSRIDCSCEDIGRKSLNYRKNSFLSNSANAGMEETSSYSDVAISFTKSIEEIDSKLKLLENKKPTLDLTLKDPSIYDNRGDRWLRCQLNTLKQRRMTVTNTDTENHHPLDEFVMRRGHTSDAIQRKTKKKDYLTPQPQKRGKGQTQQRSRSKSTPKHLSGSLDQGLNTNCNSVSRKKSESRNQVRRRGASPSLSSSNQSLNSLRSEPATRSVQPPSMNMSTQTEIADTQRKSGIPKSLLSRKDSMGNKSRIPRPVIQRSKSMDGASISRIRKRNLENTGSPRLVREKSDISGKMVIRREKSDLTGRQSKYKQTTRESTNTPRKRAVDKKEKAVPRARNTSTLV